MTSVLYNIGLAVLAFCIYPKSERYLHMAQLEGYKPGQYWGWMKKNIRNVFFNEFILFSVVLILFIADKLFKNDIIWGYVILLVWGGCSIYEVLISMRRKIQAKTPLVFTHRAVRLFTCHYLLLAFWSIIGYVFSDGAVLFLIYIAIVKLLVPLNMLLSTVLTYPLEMAFHYRYFHLAQIKIRSMKNLKVIGITGSYGKTSTKYFVNTILSERFNTLMTPESYNTPMGITKVIREQLNEKHEVFVCEMGARNVGDIKTLCRLTTPTMGILTSIGPQHLETFKSIDNVAKTKYELIEALPYDGTAIFNGDNRYCLELARKTGIQTYIYGVDKNDEDFYITASDIVNSREGLKFRVHGQDGIDFVCQTPLLGKHNVSNMLAAICTAFSLGMTVDEIKSGVSKIKPVPHRLQLMGTNNGVTVIDDAFNSNPEGAKQALETLKEFTGGSRIVVTPGMVELGNIEYRENKKFGKLMASCADRAILVGKKRSKPIIEGLKEGNFQKENIDVVSSRDEATEVLGRIVKAGDIVIFENDLPDNYNEE